MLPAVCCSVRTAMCELDLLSSSFCNDSDRAAGWGNPSFLTRRPLTVVGCGGLLGWRSAGGSSPPGTWGLGMGPDCMFIRADRALLKALSTWKSQKSPSDVLTGCAAAAHESTGALAAWVRRRTREHGWPVLVMPLQKPKSGERPSRTRLSAVFCEKRYLACARPTELYEDRTALDVSGESSPKMLPSCSRGR